MVVVSSDLGERKSRIDSPVPNRETHGVTDYYDGNYCFSAQLPIGVNAVAYRKLEPYGIDKADESHPECQTDPVDGMRSSNAPEDKSSRNQE